MNPGFPRFAPSRSSAPRGAVLRPRAALLLLGVALAASGCAPAQEPPGGPNILIVTLDTTRADHLGTYGYFRDTSPVIDALAREAIVFERAIVPMATTLPTHLSILTATHPLEHGVLANSTQGGGRFVPSPKLRSFATVARQAGYRTGAFVSAAPLKRGSGIETGFETFDQPAEKQRDARATTDAALAWLRREKHPFLLWVHYYDAHWRFEAPAPYDTMYRTDAGLEAYIAERQIPDTAPRPLVGTIDEARASINAYDGEIRYQDAQLGRLFEELRSDGRWEKTVVLLVGDHGEGLCQHGEAAHGGTWNEQLHAPMMIRVPGVPPRRVEQVVSVIDAVPTLLSLIGVPELDTFRDQATGRNILAPDAQPAPILSQDTGRQRPGPYRFGLTTDRWKYLRVHGEDGNSWEQLYDLSRDPYESEDVARLHPGVTRRLQETLDAELAARRARGRALHDGAAPPAAKPDPELLEQLRALGYLESEGPAE